MSREAFNHMNAIVRTICLSTSSAPRFQWNVVQNDCVVELVCKV